jgi:hypothetical protein
MDWGGITIVQMEPKDLALEAEVAYEAPALLEYGTIAEWTAGRLGGAIINISLIIG